MDEKLSVFKAAARELSRLRAKVWGARAEDTCVLAMQVIDALEAVSVVEQEAVQRAVDARIAEFAAALEASIQWSGGLVEESLKQELRKWPVLRGLREPTVIGFWGAEPVSVPLCTGCGGVGRVWSVSGKDWATCPVCNPPSYSPPVQAEAPPIPRPAPLSQCCDFETFVEDNQRLVCRKCGCTRPL